MHRVRPARTGTCRELKGQKYDSSGTLARKYQEINFYTHMSQSYKGDIIIPILDRIYPKYQEHRYSKANAFHTECLSLEIILNLPFDFFTNLLLNLK